MVRNTRPTTTPNVTPIPMAAIRNSAASAAQSNPDSCRCAQLYSIDSLRSDMGRSAYQWKMGVVESLSSIEIYWIFRHRSLVLPMFNIIWTHNVYYYFLVSINRRVTSCSSKSLLLAAISQDVNNRSHIVRRIGSNNTARKHNQQQSARVTCIVWCNDVAIQWGHPPASIAYPMPISLLELATIIVVIECSASAGRGRAKLTSIFVRLFYVYASFTSIFTSIFMPIFTSIFTLDSC